MSDEDGCTVETKRALVYVIRLATWTGLMDSFHADDQSRIEEIAGKRLSGRCILGISVTDNNKLNQFKL